MQLLNLSRIQGNLARSFPAYKAPPVINEPLLAVVMVGQRVLVHDVVMAGWSREGSDLSINHDCGCYDHGPDLHTPSWPRTSPSRSVMGRSWGFDGPARVLQCPDCLLDEQLRPIPGWAVLVVWQETASRQVGIDKLPPAGGFQIA